MGPFFSASLVSLTYIHTGSQRRLYVPTVAAAAARHKVAEGRLNAGVEWDQPVRNAASDRLTGGNGCFPLHICVCVIRKCKSGSKNLKAFLDGVCALASTLFCLGHVHAADQTCH